MKIEGSEHYPVESNRLLALLKDASVLRRVLPGCTALSAISSDEYRLEVQQRVGPYDDLFTGILSLQESELGDGLGISADVESANGLIHFSGHVDLDPTGEAETFLHYNGIFEVEGQLATVTPRLLQTTANAYVRRLLEALENEIATGGAPPRQSATAPSAPSVTRTRAAVPAWVVVLVAGLAGVVVLRLLDNRRINRLTAGHAAESTTRSGSG